MIDFLVDKWPLFVSVGAGITALVVFAKNLADLILKWKHVLNVPSTKEQAAESSLTTSNKDGDNQSFLERQRSELEFQTQLAIHVAQTRYSEESAILNELWKRLVDLRKASNDLTIRKKSAAYSEEKVASLRSTLADARKEFGFWREEKTLLIPQSVSEAVDRVVDVIAREADRVPDSHFPHPTLVDFDGKAFANISALNAMMDKVKVAIEACRVSLQSPTLPRNSGL